MSLELHVLNAALHAYVSRTQPCYDQAMSLVKRAMDLQFDMECGVCGRGDKDGRGDGHDDSSSSWDALCSVLQEAEKAVQEAQDVHAHALRLHQDALRQLAKPPPAVSGSTRVVAHGKQQLLVWLRNLPQKRRLAGGLLHLLPRRRCRGEVEQHLRRKRAGLRKVGRGRARPASAQPVLGPLVSRKRIVF
jgi:hypothetical protein